MHIECIFHFVYLYTIVVVVPSGGICRVKTKGLGVKTNKEKLLLLMTKFSTQQP